MITNISIYLLSHVGCGFWYFLMWYETEPIGISFLYFYLPSHIFRWDCYCHWGCWSRRCLRNVCRRSLLTTEVMSSVGTICFIWEFYILFFIQINNYLHCILYKLQFGPTLHGNQLIEHTVIKTSVYKRFWGDTPPSIALRVHET